MNALDPSHRGCSKLSGLSLVVALTCCPPPALAQAVPSPPALPAVADLQVTVEPATAVVGYKENAGNVKVLLTNLASEDRKFRVDLGRLQLEGGDVVARAKLPNYGKADWAEVAVAGKGTETLAVAVEGLTHLGTYDGLVRVRTVAPTATETVRSMQLVRLSSGFDLAFSGQDVTNGVITLKPKSEYDTKFSFLVENSKTSGETELTIAVASEFSGKKKAATLTVEPKTLSLPPGAAATVQLTLSDLPASGDFSGRLRFSDARSGAAKHLDVRLQPTFVPFRDWLYIFGLVAFGAGLSALVGAAIPNLISRNRLWRRVGDLRQALSALPAAEQHAKGALGHEVQRVDELVNEADWYTPSAAERLAEQEKKTTELEQRLALLSEVSEYRNEAQTSSEVPSSARVRLFRALDAVAADVAKASLEVAKVKVDEIAKNIAAARASTDLRVELDAVVANLPTAAPGNANSVMAARLQRLRAEHAALGAAASREELLELDYQAQCAQLYFKRYLGEVLLNNPGNQAFLDADADIVGVLTRGKAEFIQAVALIESLQSGVTAAAMNNALSNLQTNADVVVSPSQPKGAELVTFRLVFKEDALNKSPLLRGVQVRWTFSAGAPEGFGPRVGQHFRTSRFKQTVSYTVSVGPGPTQQLTGSLEIPRHRLLGGFVTQAEALSFLITLAGAVVLAVLSKSSEMRPLETVQDYINPFLWGFGLDRMKALVTAHTKAAS